MLGYGISIGRYNYAMGICSVGVLTDCKCDDTSLTLGNIHTNKYFSSSLIASTDINVWLNAVAISVQTFIYRLTDSLSLICGDKTGTTWCGNRIPIIWDADNNQEYDMTQPNSLLSFNSITSMLSIQATQPSQVGTYNFYLRAKLLDYPSIGYFPQTTSFTLTVLSGEIKVLN
jgi:hypothetical protein